MPSFKFKAKSHIISLLGDQLIGSDSLAIFELVKNSYDADANNVYITFQDLNTPTQSIIVEDDGTGMTLETLEKAWLEIGTDLKRGKKRKISEKNKRVSLGEKGVGRLAIHKLGKKITILTQYEGSEHVYSLSFNWQTLIDSYEYINDVIVEIKQMDEKIFETNQGTRIKIENLSKPVWSKNDLKELAKKILSIKSPFFDKKDNFNVKINAGEFQSWIEEIKSVDDILDNSIYCFDFKLKKTEESVFANLSWKYKFTPPKGFGIQENEIKKIDHSEKKDTTGNEYLNVFNIKPDKEAQLFKKEQKHLLNEDLKGIGDITGRFYVFNLQSVVLKNFGQTQVIKSYVKENCGVKVFRNGIRVYNYGEKNDDWLGLDLKRVQKLGGHFSKNTVIGAIELVDKDNELYLVEKTNREGFDENVTFKRFQEICIQIFNLFEDNALKDREKLRNYLEGYKPTKATLPETMVQIKEKLTAKNLDKELSPLLKKVEKDYNDMREVMLNSGLTGLNLGLIFHEVDREIKFINVDLNNNVDISSIKQKIKNLIQLLEDFSPLLKKNKSTTIFAHQLISTSLQFNLTRFKYHNIKYDFSQNSEDSIDFVIDGSANLLVSALSNILDNSIYWVSCKKELEGDKYSPEILINTDVDNFKGPAIIIADNGNGFTLEPEDLVMPYRTTKPGGMGLGLYYVDKVMEIIGGKLLFPDKQDIEIPDKYCGAIVALVFPKKR